MKKNFHVSFVIMLCIGFTFFAVFRLNEYLTLERISIQLDAGYQIVFIDPTYFIGICGLITMPAMLLHIIWTHVLGKKVSKHMDKLFAMIILVGLIVATIGMSVEHQRQKSIARANGFIECPSFTLLSSTHIVEAMVKDIQYCTDDTITSIAKYGYFRELPIVNAYVEKAYGNKE